MGEDDRRKFKRRKKQSIISFYVIETKSRKNIQEGVVVDYSLGGVRFTAKKPMEKNTQIYIKLDSEEWGEELTFHCKDPQMGLIEIVGSVMWCLESGDTPGEYEVGTRFLGQLEH